MADEQDKSQKTEAPTPKRLEDARKKGDIAKSQDVPVWFLLAAAAAVIAAAGPLSAAIARPLTAMLDHPHEFRLTDGGGQRLLSELVMTLAFPLIIIFGALFVATLLGHLVQHRPLWTAEKMKPDLSKLSPMKGFGRLFGVQGWVNLLKAFLKFVAVSAAVAYAVWPDRLALAEAGRLDIAALMMLGQQIAGRLFIAALVVVGIIAAMDWLWQRYSFMERMKMSRQEIRDETKQSEGDPHIRARLRQIRMERAGKRMMANLPKATVVITNPTHYSVALRYEADTDAAPVCVAKGVDAVALRIREVAKEHDIPIVENVALARALFATVDVDGTIPRDHFEAVAKIISFVMRTRKGRRAPA